MQEKCKKTCKESRRKEKKSAEEQKFYWGYAAFLWQWV